MEAAVAVPLPKQDAQVRSRSDVSIAKNSYRDLNEELASVDVVMSTDRFVPREKYDFKTGSVIRYFESLEMTPQAIRMERLNNGLPVLNNHEMLCYNSEGIGSLLGNVQKSWIDTSGDSPALKATLHLSKLDAVEKKIAAKVRNNLIRNVSIGYIVHKYKDVTRPDDPVKRKVAIDWEPVEVSLVDIPADPTANIRSLSKQTEEKDMSAQAAPKVITKTVVPAFARNRAGYYLITMKRQLTEDQVEALERIRDGAPEDADWEVLDEVIETAREALGSEEDDGGSGEAEERKKQVLAKLQATPEPKAPEPNSELAELKKFVEKGFADFKKQFEQGQAEEQASQISQRRELNRERTVFGQRAQTEQRIRDAKRDPYEVSYLAVDALTAKCTNHNKKFYDYENDNPYLEYSLLGIARKVLQANGYEHLAGEPPARLYDILINPNRRMRDFMPASRYSIRASGSAGAPVSTSDFVDLLSNLGDKLVFASYDNLRLKQTFEPFVTRTRDLANYKEQTRIKIGSFGDLAELHENEDIQYGGTSEEKENMRLRTFGHAFQITERAFVDDDTRELTRLFNAGTAAAKKESDVVYEQIFSGKVNGKPLFDASHNNVLTGKTIFDTDGSVGTAIPDADYALSTQTIMGDENTQIDFNLGMVIAPKALKYEFLKFQTEVSPTLPKYAQIMRDFEMITESRLDRSAAGNKTFYAIADMSEQVIPFIELAYMQGRTKPMLVTAEDTENESLSFYLRHRVTAKVMDYRPIVKVTLA